MLLFIKLSSALLLVLLYHSLHKYSSIYYISDLHGTPSSTSALFSHSSTTTTHAVCVLPLLGSKSSQELFTTPRLPTLAWAGLTHVNKPSTHLSAPLSQQLCEHGYWVVGWLLYIVIPLLCTSEQACGMW